MDKQSELFKMTLIIHGRVQGIFFREETCNLANKLDIVGYVDNVPDGTVSVIAEGTKEKLNELKAWCAHGPKMARVEKVEEEFEPIKSFSFKKFSCPFH